MKAWHKVLIFWLACASVSSGALLADFQHMDMDPKIRYCREDMGVAWGAGLIGGPITLAMSPFLTGFYEHGFQWTCLAPQ